MNKNALIIVDYSIDFIANDGKLTCGKLGQEIEDSFMEQMAVVYMEKLVKYTRKTSIIHKSITWIKQDMIHFMVHH